MNTIRFYFGLAIAYACAFAIRPSFAFAAPQDDTNCDAEPIAAIAQTHITNGSVTTRKGGVIAYEAEAGWERVGGDDAVDRLLMGDGEPSSAVRPGSPAALMSYVAYFAKSQPAVARPIMFIWEGGPGTSTEMMVISSFGPVLHADPGQMSSPILMNPDTLLDATDIVFVDAPGTGFGRLEGCVPQRSFYGINVDAAAFRRFIQRFLGPVDEVPDPQSG